MPEPAMPATINDLSVDMLCKVMSFAGLKSSHTLARTTMDWHATWAGRIYPKAALRIQRFWRWCRYFSTTKILAARFMRLRLTPAEMTLAT
jgi:hypothetical protein